MCISNVWKIDLPQLGIVTLPTRQCQHDLPVFYLRTLVASSDRVPIWHRRQNDAASQGSRLKLKNCATGTDTARVGNFRILSVERSSLQRRCTQVRAVLFAELMCLPVPWKDLAPEVTSLVLLALGEHTTCLQLHTVRTATLLTLPLQGKAQKLHIWSAGNCTHFRSRVKRASTNNPFKKQKLRNLRS